MARQLTAVPDIDSPDASYPAGKIRNDNPPTTDGTPVVEELYGDIIQFFHKLMRLAGITYNDTAENETAGFQFIEALAFYMRSLAATETQKGTSERATNAEVQAGSDTSRFVTPAGLESKTATEARKGIDELANSSEALALSPSHSRIVTPLKLREFFDYIIGSSTLTITSANTYNVDKAYNLIVINFSTTGTNNVIINLPTDSDIRFNNRLIQLKITEFSSDESNLTVNSGATVLIDSEIQYEESGIAVFIYSGSGSFSLLVNNLPEV